jgi:hypothetical protein
MIKTSKKVVLAVMAALGLMTVASMPASAAFSSVTRSTIQATVSIGASAGSVAMFAEPRVIGSSTTATALTWTVSALPVATQGNWLLSNNYIHMVATVTASGGV